MNPAMYAFVKRLRNNQHTRRFSIATTSSGWEVREEHDSKVVRRTALSDWHRVEQARRSINRESAALEDQGWLEEMND